MKTVSRAFPGQFLVPLIASLLLLGSGCPDDGRAGDDDDAQPPQIVPPQPDFVAGGGYASVAAAADAVEWRGRWVFRLPNDLAVFPASWQRTSPTCPIAPGSDWSSERLFPDTAAIVSWQSAPSTLNEERARYCVYTWRGRGEPGNLAELSTDGTRDGRVFASARAQRNIVGYYAHLDRAMHANAWGHFVAAAGGRAFTSLSAPQTMVRVELLDTAPTGDITADLPEQSGIHGYAMGNIARAVLCDEGGDCGVELAHRQAMNQRLNASGDPEDVAAGEPGNFGSTLHLAQAIDGALRAWKARPDRGNVKLVLSLSLVWHPDHDGAGTDPGAWSPDVRAVFTALQDASCSGALVLAAAGNRGTGPSGQGGIMLPALWQRAPLWTKCSGSDASLSAEIDQDEGRPILYAVGGFDRSGSPLPNARTNGLPQFAAYGLQVPGTGSGDEPGVTWTGTSVSTVLVASIASARWTANSSATPFDIMKNLHANVAATMAGEDVNADLRDGATGFLADNAVRTLSFCNAFRCTGLPTPPAPGDTASFRNLARDVVSNPIEIVSPPAHCRGTAYRDASLTSDFTACPETAALGISHVPSVGPQPHKGECPYCLIDLTDMSNPRANLDFDTELGAPYTIYLKTQQGAAAPETTPYTYDHSLLTPTTIGTESYWSAEILLTDSQVSSSKQLIDAWVTAYAQSEPSAAVTSSFSVQGP